MTLSHAANPGRHSFEVRENDYYETPEVAVRALLSVEHLPHWLWECAAGGGAIARVLRDDGHAVICSDIVPRDGFALHFTADFLTTTKAPVACEAVISNPPYRLADQFARHALNLVPRVYLLLRLAFMESVRRADILEGGALARVHVFARRLPRMHRAGWDGRRATLSVAYAWFCWNRDHRGPTTIDRISWERD
jgi:hypothetical protein